MRQVLIDIGMDFAPAAIDQYRDHVGCLEEAGIIALAVCGFVQQGLVGLGQFSVRARTGKSQTQACKTGNQPKSRHFNLRVDTADHGRRANIGTGGPLSGG